MANFNLAKVATGTTGTGTLTLGSAVSGFLTFAQAGVVDGQTVSYGIVDGTNSEVGRGVYTASGTTLTRSVLKSTNSNNAINLSGSAVVFTTVVAEDLTVGKHWLWIPALAMVPRITNGPSLGSVEMTTNKNMFSTLDFDASTPEFAQFAIAKPPSWDEGTVTFKPVLSHAATTTNFGMVFQLAGVAISDGDAGDVAFGTAQTSTKTGGTTNSIYIGPESSAVTIAGTPQAGDYVMFQISRVPANASDTLAVDARLHGIHLAITTAAGNDA